MRPACRTCVDVGSIPTGSMEVMVVQEQVEAALGGRSDWRAEVARALARQLDIEPNASLARELRTVMGGIEDEALSVGGTPLDELARRRASR